jgi:predicted phosphodiesterase
MPKTNKILTLLFCLLFIACTARIFNTTNEIRLDDQGRIDLEKSPYQCYLAPEKIIIGAELPEGSSANLVYWEEGYPATSRSVPFESHWESIYHAIPDELDISKSYVCAVEIDGIKSRTYPINPGSPQGDEFSFLVLGDTRAGNALAHKKLIDEMNRYKAAFYIHTGDFVHDATDPDQWNEFFEIEKPLLSKMPIVPVAGNHDISDIGIYTNLFFREERFYSFEYANIMVLVIDSTIPIEKGDRQYRYLEKELARYDNSGLDHLFVAVHHPPFSSGKHGYDMNVMDTVVPLLEKHDIVAVMSGHEHNYERTKPINGIVYLVTGGGGSPLRPVDFSSFTEKALVALHFIKITVSGESVYMQTIDINGKVVDEARLR